MRNCENSSAPQCKAASVNCAGSRLEVAAPQGSPPPLWHGAPPGEGPGLGLAMGPVPALQVGPSCSVTQECSHALSGAGVLPAGMGPSSKAQERVKAPTANVHVNLPNGDPGAPFPELAVVPEDLVPLLLRRGGGGTGDQAGPHGHARLGRRG